MPVYASFVIENHMSTEMKDGTPHTVFSTSEDRFSKFFHKYKIILENIDWSHVQCVRMIKFDGQSSEDLTSLVGGQVQ